jgi:hypothetical protein
VITALLAAALMPTPAAEATKKEPFCRGVLLKDEQGTFLLITLKVSGAAPSRRRVSQAAKRLGAYLYEKTDDGSPILNVGFTSNIAGEEVVRLWKDIREGVYGAVTVEPFTFPGSWIKADGPCFGSAANR